MAFDLNTGFDTLCLQPSKHSTTSPKFTLFPTLPAELRLKILNHALPIHTTLKVRAEIKLADPDFGLYMNFSLYPAIIEPSSSPPHFGNHEILAPKEWYHEARALDLLLVNQEFRTYYLENFPCSLPTFATSTAHTPAYIRYSPRETIYFRNFTQLTSNGEFARAMQDGWRLQKFWTEIEELQFAVDSAVVLHLEMSVAFLRSCSALRVARGKLWRYFGVMEDRMKAVFKAGLRRRLREIERRLRDEGGDGYVVPKFELVA